MRIARFPTTMNNTNPTTARRAQTRRRWSLRRRRVVAGAELITEAVAAMYQPYSCRGREGQRVAPSPARCEGPTPRQARTLTSSDGGGTSPPVERVVELSGPSTSRSDATSDLSVLEKRV